MSVALYRDLALRIAQKEVGVKEHPAGSNDGPRVREYESVTGAYREPWCASFVQWCLKEAGVPQPFLSRSAYVPFIVSAARRLGWVVKTPAPGDLVCFDWEHNGVADHIGFVLEPLGGGRFRTVEGNTAIGNNSNGGEVMIRDRDVSEVQAFIRVPGARAVADPRKPPKVIPSWAWKWVEWSLGRGPFKGHAHDPKLRPKSAPARIPAWAWTFLRRFVK